MKKIIIIIQVVIAVFMAVSVLAQDATEIMKKSHLAYYYAGSDGLAEVSMTLIDKKGKERKRVFSMLRLDIADGGNQNYYTYFKKPSDVSRLTFMVHKSPDGNDKRWIYVPAVDLVKPISADDKNSSFVGSDFTYEDVSGRHWSEDSHTLKDDGEIDGKPVHTIESTPKETYKGFSRKISFIDKETLLPLKEEYYNKKDKMIRIFTAVKIEVIDGNPTITIRSIENLKKRSKTVVEFTSIKYDIGITKDIFTERYLKNPPRKFIR
jgi:outer membrane lipoprotein-sorting protein